MAGPIKTQNPTALLDVDDTCRNWTQDEDGVQREMGNHATAILQLVSKFNQLASRFPITVFSKTDILGSVRGDSLDPWVEWRAKDRIDNAMEYVVRISAQPRSTDTYTGNAYAERTGTAVDEYTSWIGDQLVGTTSNSYHDSFEAGYKSAVRGAMAGELTDGITTVEGYKICDAVVQYREQAALQPGYHMVVNPNLAGAEKYVLADVLEEVRAKFHRLRTTQMPRVASWSCHDETDSFSITTDAARQNLLEPASSARTAVTPGPMFYCYLGGLGREDKSYGQRVPITCRVKARWESPVDVPVNIVFVGPEHVADNEVFAEIPANVAVDWYNATGYLWGNPQVDETCTNVDRNKVDIFVDQPAEGGGTVGDVYVHGFYCEYQSPELSLTEP